MVNRKTSKTPKHRRHGPHRSVSKKARPLRRRFIISAKSASHSAVRTPEKRNGHSKSIHVKVPPPTKTPGLPAQTAGGAGPGTAPDLTETIKTLLHLAQENGYVTYDDINDILPDNLNPEVGS